MNVLAGLTGTASGGMAIVLNAFGDNFMSLAAEHGIDPDLMHRVTTTSAGTLDALPHNGTVLLLLNISGLTHRESYFGMVMTVIVGVNVALVASSSWVRRSDHFDAEAVPGRRRARREIRRVGSH